MKLLSYFTTVFGLSVLVALVLGIYHTNVGTTFSSPTSPLPDFLTLAKNKEVRFLDLWFPHIETVESSTKKPEPTARAVLMYELSQEKTLFEKASKEKMPMASLTKIMTAIVALENPKKDGLYRARGEHLVGEDSMGITPNEAFTLEELLYGLMLNSGNDASEVIAGNHPEGREGFLRAMEKKAEALGLSDTKFSNPSGLQGDGVQHTTAYDLLVMTRYAVEHFPELVEISGTYERVLPANDYHKEFHLVNETNLISTYPGVRGFKTGYTPEAGMCLVTYFEQNDKKIIGVLLNSESRREEMKQLLEYSLTQLGETPPKYTPRQ
jgi:serine-type D-Ala-D-Ala carboxypeptidase (penicillin-binding protein 5/6)